MSKPRRSYEGQAVANSEKRVFRRTVWPLAIAQTIAWAAVYYSFPALLPAWERDLGWSKAALSGAFTVSLAVSAILAPLVGRIIDRGYASQLLTGSNLLGATGLVALSGVTVIWQFYVAWIILGAAMAGMLYEACFVVLTRTMGERSKQAITLVTLVAGFAGTLSFPGNTALEAQLGWRGTMWILAAVVALIAAPLNWSGTRAAGVYDPPEETAASVRIRDGLVIMRHPAFWMLAASFGLLTLNHGMLITHLLPLLDALNISEGGAVLAASMIGPMQVAGRLLMMAVERRISSLRIFTACFVAIGLASMSLLGANGWPWLIAGFVFFQGSGAGVTSIMRPVITADLLGRKNFGLVAGMLAVISRGGIAVAPTLAALIWGVGGYDLVAGMAIVAAAFGLLALLVAASLASQPKPNASVRL